MVIFPLSISYSLNNNFAIVVLPDPVSPTIPIEDPNGMDRLKSSNKGF